MRVVQNVICQMQLIKKDLPSNWEKDIHSNAMGQLGMLLAHLVKYA